VLDPAHIRERVARFLAQRIEPAIVSGRMGVPVSAWNAPGEPVPFAHAVTQDYAPVARGYRWGAPWSTTWFRIRAAVPAPLREPPPELVADLGFADAQVGFQAEGLAYDSRGTVIKGVNPRSRWVPLAEAIDGDGNAEVYIEAAGNPAILTWGMGLLEFAPTELGDPRTAGTEPAYSLGRVEIVRRNADVAELAHDLRVLWELERELPEQSARRWSILETLRRALDALNPADIAGTACHARELTARALAVPAEPSAHALSAIGHSHIDSAWLWPFRETRRKVARTVANVLQLMDTDPDLRYAMSSAQHFAWLKEDHPALFGRVRRRVEQGRFVPVGGMWVESDTNMPSGESLVRQFLEGARFFRDEFGLAGTSIVWLPDSFGYSAALPQIITGTGAHRFLTQKISWNATNRFPHHTFWWEGIDGSRVLTHFPSADMYNSQLLGAEVWHAARNFADKDITNRSLLPFGFGDGGGGPTREMLARARRLRDVEGSPRVQIESPEKFFDQTESELESAPSWVGELYLEFHRGVLTSQAATKRGNRACEALFREAELWSSQAAIRAGAPYPYEEFQHLWRRFLLLQFHDVLPGSSIAWVHDEAEREYGAIVTALEQTIGRALARLGDRGTEASPSEPLVANASPFSRSGVPAHSIGVAVAAADRATAGPDGPSGGVRLRNGAIEARIDTAGAVVSLVSLPQDREIVPHGARLGELQLFADTPNRWDAWDVDEAPPAAGRPWDSIGRPEHGIDSRGAWVHTILSTARSRVTQTIRLDHGATMLAFTTEADWNERETLLKVSYPLSVAAERWAAETQFGHVYRPTTANTSWEAAKFEACAHRWVHVGEPGFGVAVVNSASYGHEVRHRPPVGGDPCTVVRISLLRGPNFPDPGADHGHHVLSYGIAPGSDISDAVASGYALGDAARPTQALVPVSALATSDVRNVVIDTVKLAEDRSGDLILRVYEAAGMRTSCTVHFGISVSRARLVDLLERDVYDVSTRGSDQRDVQLTLRPFQIATIRVTPLAAEQHSRNGEAND
jgi:alpha-mannosidase